MTDIVNYTALGVILDGLLNRLGEPDEKIERDNKPYLHRWHIVREHGKQNVYLHKFLGDDNDEALHDHPWSSVSIILNGTYKEITPDGEFIRKTGDVIFRDEKEPHRIELIHGPAYSLFITGPKVKEWGFFCDKGFKHWLDFEKDGGCD